MTQTRSNYLSIAADYAKSAEAFFAPVAVPKITSRSATTQATTDELLARAEVVLPKSAAFNAAAEAQLQDAQLTMPERADTGAQLLSKMLVDLNMSKDLLDAANADAGTRAVGAAGTRSAQSKAELRKALQGVTATSAAQQQRSAAGVPVTDVSEAKDKLSDEVNDVFDVISRRSVAATKKIVSNAVDLGFAQIAQGAGDVVKAAANWLGKTENLNRLVETARKFLARAYEAALKIIGQAGLDLAESKVVNWLKELVENREEKIDAWLEGWYQKAVTQPKVLAMVQESAASLDGHVKAINAVSSLNTNFKKYVDIVDGLMKLMPLLKTAVVAFQQPAAIFGVAVFYVLAFAIVMLTGGAFLDSPKLDVLKRIQGVSDLVSANLKG